MSIKNYPNLVKEVASVIGLRRAKVELKKLLEVEQLLDGGIEDTELACAIVWASSPQGHDFWSKIQRKIDPSWFM